MQALRPAFVSMLFMLSTANIVIIFGMAKGFGGIFILRLYS